MDFSKLNRKKVLNMKSNVIELRISTNKIDSIPILENLLIEEGFSVQRNYEIQKDDMGIDPSTLTIVIPAVTAAITGLTSILKLVAVNQSVEYKIEDKNNKRVFSFKSQSGKNLSEKELSEVLSKVYLNNKEEE